MPFAIKAAIPDPAATAFTFAAQKSMYGGRHVAAGDTIFLFASENEGGTGLFARGVVTSAEAVARQSGLVRQTPRINLAVRRTSQATRRLGRAELRLRVAGLPSDELHFKLYRQATNKVVGLSEAAAAFLDEFFEHPLANLPGDP